MELVFIIGRLCLAIVFLVAAITKLADQDGSRRALEGFGLRGGLGLLTSRALPVTELFIALALIPTATASLGAVAAALLLLTFVAAMTINLVQGRKPDCHCFGQLHSRPIGWKSVFSNLGLAGIAVLIALGSPFSSQWSTVDLFGHITVTGRLLLVLGVAALFLLVVAIDYLRRILRYQSDLSRRFDALQRMVEEDYSQVGPLPRAEVAPPEAGLPVGAPAPSFELPSVGGAKVTLLDLLSSSKPVMLIFASANCAPCKSVLTSVAGWQRDDDQSVTIAVLAKGDRNELDEWPQEYGVRHLLLQGKTGISEDYEAKWTPAAVIINKNARIGSSVVYGEDAIKKLTESCSRAERERRINHGRRSSHTDEPSITILTPAYLERVGEYIPEFTWRDLTGAALSSKEMLGRDTLLLFWDPDCEYCQAMSSDILRWEEQPPINAPRLFFIASGNEDSVRAESVRFNSRFLFDPDMDSYLLFGTNMTPSAVLVDADGRLASGPTSGRQNIMALAGVRKQKGDVSTPVGSLKMM
jgi:thiol-disulfide isomerase/thioredoxin